MAVRVSTWFASQGINGFNWKNSKTRFLVNPSSSSSSSSSRLLFASCRMRQRHISSMRKRPYVKKASPELLRNGEAESDSEITSTDSVPITNQNSSSNDDVSSSDSSSLIESDDTKSLESASNDSVSSNTADENIDFEDLSALREHDDTKLEVNSAESISGVQLEDLIGMIRNSEKNILLLNRARIRALEDLEKILDEKEALQTEINSLEMRLAETDARIKVAAQEKIHVELLEDHLEKLRDELTDTNNLEKSEESTSHDTDLDLLRMENLSLRTDIENLKNELVKAKSSEERIAMLEKERALLESSLKDLEYKLSTSQKDALKHANLKVEYENLLEKVENLQILLDKATVQANQAIIVLQQNQDLRKKVDKLEESLAEAKKYKLSSEKLQRYNDLMQQKLKSMEEQIQKSDEEIHAYVQLYQESVQEFQDTLSNLKEANEKKSNDEPVDNMPWEFWSRLLLIIDGWLIEKKMSSDDAEFLRKLVWARDKRVHNAYMACKEKNEHDALATFLALTSSPKSSGLHVVHIAAEMAPVAKVGGLGDVVAGLGKALQKKGHLVEIILPKYDCLKDDMIPDLRVLDAVQESYFDGRLYKNRIWVGTVEGLPVYFIEPLHPDKFFQRGQFYGEHDDFRRFSYFSLSALELLHQAGKKPDIIHCHDWQTSFVAPLYWDLYVPKGMNSARICFTCHNFEYQGNAPASQLTSCGLDVDQLNRPDRMQDHSGHDRVNPVKGAVVFSNVVTTVSPTYAQEVRTAEGGKGLHSTLNLHSKKFIGILNGIDTDAWNPATDKFLKVQYSANDLKGKTDNKEALRRMLGLSSTSPKKPLVSCITRLVPQKGVHLIRHAIYRTLELGGQFVLLGSSPVNHIQREFEGIASQFQKHDDIRLVLKYDESLSHSIYAASDMFIIPSIFEPCGLTQMIAMRYGAIPIARKTGGLHDSVFDVDDDTIPPAFQNGYTFLNPDEQALNYAMERAFERYTKHPQSWQQLVHKVMKIDFSWDSSATQYEELYSKALERARSRTRS